MCNLDSLIKGSAVAADRCASQQKHEVLTLKTCQPRTDSVRHARKIRAPRGPLACSMPPNEEHLTAHLQQPPALYRAHRNPLSTTPVTRHDCSCAPALPDA
ncbi:hypothetical protein SKAU_G00018270 [Synaphobranchus kaupii]|uniref:Uncharacterized protein n=1 Tax=Synaphobranchus kaupii TaxID=118154 RepID=A0A9Q1GBE5_SYNKA|nr:hypothetical protein SKAU_G00018270 [Synaphobranchus kaupii]